MLHIAHVVYKADRSKCLAEGDVNTFREGNLPPNDQAASLFVVDFEHSDVYRRVHVMLDAYGLPVTLGSGASGIAYLVKLDHLPYKRTPHPGNNSFACPVMSVMDATIATAGNEVCMDMKTTVCVMKLPNFLHDRLVIDPGTGHIQIKDYEQIKDLPDAVSVSKTFRGEITMNQRLLLGKAAVNAGLFDEGEISLQTFRKIVSERDTHAKMKGYKYLHKIVDYALHPFPCIISERCDGDLITLTEHAPYVWGTPQRPSPLFIKMIYSVYYGLQYIHARGLTHSDIKPDNIFYRVVGPSSDLTDVAPEVDFLIADFGLMDYADTSLGPAGTPRYWPPEYHDVEKKRCDKSMLVPKSATAYIFCRAMLYTIIGAQANAEDDAIFEYIDQLVAGRQSLNGHQLHYILQHMIVVMRQTDLKRRFQKFEEFGCDLDTLYSTTFPEPIAIVE